MTLIYLHGFNSDGTGLKPDQLRKNFPEALLLAPDLEANPQQVVEQVQQLLNTSIPPIYLVGSSLGGFYAYYFSAIFSIPCFLYNPSLNPHRTLHRGIGHHQTWIKGRDYHFKAAYLPMLEALKKEAEALVQQYLLNFFLATDDDVLDLSPIPGLFPAANHLSWHPKASHSFSKFKKTMPTVRQLIQQYTTEEAD